MHELGIAQDVPKVALTEAEKHNGRGISALHVKLGEASHIEPASLEFCLEAIARCPKCDYTFSGHSPLCPRCGGTNLEVVSGKEITLDSLELD